MNYSAYHSKCSTMGKEILGRLSEADKQWLEDYKMKLTPDEFRQQQKNLHNDVLQFLRLTPSQRVKEKKFSLPSKRLLITFYAIFYLRFAWIFLEAMQEIPIDRQYRATIADCAEQFLHLRYAQFDVHFEDDSF